MTYKEKEIDGTPTLEMIREYIDKKRLVISAIQIYRHYSENGWMTASNNPVKTLESAINGCNSYPLKYKKNYKECQEDYERLLNTPEWHAFSEKVKDHYSYECQMCGSKLNLRVHHKWYHLELLPWEYEMDEMTVLCKNCHEKTHEITFSNVIKAPQRFIEKGRKSCK